MSGRPPHLRLCRLPFALATLLFCSPYPLFLIILPPILTSGSCILILLCSPSHQCTSERARSVKIIWR
jgi:hypothetical protein